MYNMFNRIPVEESFRTYAKEIAKQYPKYEFVFEDTVRPKIIIKIKKVSCEEAIQWRCSLTIENLNQAIVSLKIMNPFNLADP